MAGTSPAMTPKYAHRKPLMDSLNSEHPPAVVTSAERPPRIWKFWGTALWGLFIFAGMFVGQVAVIVYFWARQGGAMDVAAAIHVVGGGLTISLSVIMGLPAMLARPGSRSVRPARRSPTISGCAGPSWSNFLLGAIALAVLVGGWDMVSRIARPRGDAGFHGRRAQIGAGRRRAVAVGYRVLRRRPDVGGDFRARLSLPRLVGIAARAFPARSCCRRWPGPRCICSMTGSSSARCSASGYCSATCATAANRPG